MERPRLDKSHRIPPFHRCGPNLQVPTLRSPQSSAIRARNSASRRSRRECRPHAHCVVELPSHRTVRPMLRSRVRRDIQQTEPQVRGVHWVCGIMAYCSKPCQTADWKHPRVPHKPLCNALQVYCGKFSLDWKKSIAWEAHAIRERSREEGVTEEEAGSLLMLLNSRY